MKNIQIRFGDVFEVKLDVGKKYFQFLRLDITQLNSEVIRAFSKLYRSSDDPSIEEITDGEIDFHAHTMIRLGYKMGLYQKIGSSKGNLTEHVTWRQTVLSGNIENRIYTDWLIWKSGDNMKPYVGPLEKLRTTELGCVHNPIDVVERMRNGEYKYVHPRFE